MKKCFVHTCFIIFCTLFFNIPGVHAGEEFETTFSAVYDIANDGTSTVTQNIKLTNKLSNVYATQYALEIGSTRISDIFAFDNAGNKITHKETTTDNKTVIVTTFDNKVVGKGQTLDFTIRYQNADTSQRTGRILEINIPKVSAESQIDSYEVIVNAPSIFGSPKIVTPAPASQRTVGKDTVLIFNSGEIMEQGITAIFGDSQVFDFNLTYNLENPTVSNAITQIALPPDTPYQKMYYENFSKKPENITEDEDKNWIATYRLEPKEKLVLQVQGSAVIYMDPVVSIPPFSHATLEKYLRPQKYWDSNHPEIEELAKKLKTPKNIYDYLVSNFTYNYDRISSGIGRLGALDAIRHPDNAICTEFTDSFIAIARSAGIPAREVNGYAHTENSVLKPLSLIQDVLHSWPEYYSYDENRWIPVDPTWGNTTGGIDYFAHLDFNHFTFAYHGISSERPFPAGYYKFDGQESKDLLISFAQNPPVPKKDFEVVFEESNKNIFSTDNVVIVRITNLSNQALYQLPIQISAQNAQVLSGDSVEIANFFTIGK